jgi:ketosteroid isomerase-like protein
MNTQADRAQAYLDAWKQQDVAKMLVMLHPQVTFKGPMAETVGRDAFINAVRGMIPMLKDVVVRHLMVDGDQAIAVYDFICAAPVGVCRTAELISFADGLIRSSEVFFDARPFEAMMKARGVVA